MKDIKPEQILDYLGIEPKDDLTIDGIKSAVAERFILRDDAVKDDKIVSAIWGQKAGTIETNIKKAVKAAGVEVPSDVKGYEAIFAHGITELGKRAAELATDLEEARKGGGSEKELAKLKADAEKFKSERDQFKAQWETLGQEFEGFKAKAETEKTEIKLSSAKADLFKGLKFADGTNEFTRKGFLAEMESKYKLNFDESGALAVFDKDGKQIPNPKKMGTILTPADVFTNEIEAAKLNPQNPAGGKPVGGAKPAGGGVGDEKPTNVNPALLFGKGAGVIVRDARPT